MTKMWRKLKRTVKRCIVDPALDVLGGVASGMYVGRTVLYGSVAYATASATMVVATAAMASVMLLDGFVHVHVLRSLRDLMRYEVLNELSGGVLRKQAIAVTAI